MTCYNPSVEINLLPVPMCPLHPFWNCCPAEAHPGAVMIGVRMLAPLIITVIDTFSDRWGFADVESALEAIPECVGDVEGNGEIAR